MGLFDVFKQKDNRANHDFDSDDRNLSLKLRQQKADMKQKQLELETANMELKAELERTKLEIDLEKTKLQLDELRGVDEQDISEDTSIDKMFMLLITQMLAKNNTPVSLSASEVVTPPQTITETEIQVFWDKIPKPQQKQLKKLNEAELTKVVQQYLPQLNDKDKDKVKEFVRNQK